MLQKRLLYVTYTAPNNPQQNFMSKQINFKSYNILKMLELLLSIRSWVSFIQCVNPAIFYAVFQNFFL
jgi:hypothetical protein